MALMPGAEFIGPIPSTNYSPNGTPKIGTVTHVIVGSAGSAISEFKSTGAQLSAHFVICGPGDQWPDGHIFQLLDTDLAAYAQAAGNYPPTSYIAMEFSGQPTTPMSAAQIASGAAIDAWASTAHGFPLVGPVAHGTPGCTTHSNPDGTADPNWGDHACPGTIRLAQVPQMIAMAIALVHPTPSPAPPTPGETEMAQTEVISFKPGQLDTFQVSIGKLWHKYAQAGVWKNEDITPTGAAAITGEPKWSIEGGACWLTVEDSNEAEYAGFQAASGVNSSTWNWTKLP